MGLGSSDFGRRAWFEHLIDLLVTIGMENGLKSLACGRFLFFWRFGLLKSHGTSQLCVPARAACRL